VALQWKKDGMDANVPIKITTYPAISPEPNSAGDVWNCPSFACSEVVYGASEELGRGLIEQHIEKHRSDGTSGQLGLAMREMNKTNLPVNNLIKRIREFTAAKELGDAVTGADKAGPTFPKPITRLLT